MGQRASKQTNRRRTRPLVHIVAVLGAVSIFLATASVIDPGQSPAAPQPGETIRTAPHRPAPDDLGSIEGGPYKLRMTAGAHEVLYDVYDSDGNRLLDDAPADEVYQLDPELLDIELWMSEPIGDVPSLTGH